MRKRLIGVVIALAFYGSRRAHAVPTSTTLANFSFASGVNPQSGVTIDSAGNIYGTTTYRGPSGFGTVFQLTGTSRQTITTLASFTATSGSGPYGGLTLDSTGNLWGTTENGGTSNYGTVFELSGTNHQTLTTAINVSATGGTNPLGNLYADGSGNLYATTWKGGSSGSGEVFELSGPNHQTSTTLANFNSIGSFPYINANGADPYGGLIADAAGNLYGTTAVGGSFGYGTVFELSGADHKTLTTLVVFNGSNGNAPLDGLIIDSAGNLYGTTSYGGTSGANGNGTVFELSGSDHKTLTTLTSFTGTNGSAPDASLIADAAGNLYGTTSNGGAHNQGTVFELSGPNFQTLTTLATFNYSNGAVPYCALAADAAGNLYGTTVGGGSSGLGTVFEITGSGFVVPEPSSLSLLAVGSLSLLRRRRMKIVY